MSIPTWDDAVSQKSAQYAPPITITSPVGAHKARMIGFTEPWTENNPCYDRNNPEHGEECKKCNGNGISIRNVIGIKYRMPNGTIEQEKVTFKISPPRKNKEGQPIRSSALYDRLLEFTQHDGNEPQNPENAWDEGRLKEWAKAHQASADVPVTVIIKQPGKYPKIVDALYREESTRGQAPTATEVAAHRQPARETLGQQRTIDEIAQRAKQNAGEHPFNDDEIPF